MRISAAFPSTYLKAADLQGRTVPVAIARVELEAIGLAVEYSSSLLWLIIKAEASRPSACGWHREKRLLRPSLSQCRRAVRLATI
jgi:hypothetical protein